MNDALLMRMLDGVANLCEQFQPLLCGEIILVAVLRDFDPAHQFHDEVRPATRKGGWSGVPLTRPAGTLYPIGGEGWGEGAPRYMGRPQLQRLDGQCDHEPLKEVTLNAQR